MSIIFNFRYYHYKHEMVWYFRRELMRGFHLHTAELLYVGFVWGLLKTVPLYACKILLRYILPFKSYIFIYKISFGTKYLFRTSILDILILNKY